MDKTIETTASPPTDRKALRRAAWAGLIGTTLEQYDFVIYGTATAIIFNRIFFPNAEPAIAIIAGFVNGESDEGGFDELVEFIPNRRFNSAFSASSAATRTRSSAITRVCSMTKAASSSYDGRPSPACTP